MGSKMRRSDSTPRVAQVASLLGAAASVALAWAGWLLIGAGARGAPPAWWVWLGVAGAVIALSGSSAMWHGHMRPRIVVGFSAMWVFVALAWTSWASGDGADLPTNLTLLTGLLLAASAALASAIRRLRG
jgi:hypothetical protein